MSITVPFHCQSKEPLNNAQKMGLFHETRPFLHPCLGIRRNRLLIAAFKVLFLLLKVKLFILDCCDCYNIWPQVQEEEEEMPRNCVPLIYYCKARLLKTTLRQVTFRRLSVFEEIAAEAKQHSC